MRVVVGVCCSVGSSCLRFTVLSAVVGLTCVLFRYVFVSVLGSALGLVVGLVLRDFVLWFDIAVLVVLGSGMGFGSGRVVAVVCLCVLVW